MDYSSSQSSNRSDKPMAGERPSLLKRKRPVIFSVGVNVEEITMVDGLNPKLNPSVSFADDTSSIPGLGYIGRSLFAADDGLVAPGNSTSNPNSLLNLSMNIRNQFNSVVRKERARTMNDMTSGEWIAKTDAITSIWELCEIMFLDTSEKLPILLNGRIVDWCNRSFNAIDNYEEKAADLKRRQFDSPYYWEFVHKYALKGEMEKAWQLISLWHPLAHNPELSVAQDGASTRKMLKELETIMRDFPKMPKTEEEIQKIRIGEFKGRWAQWHKTVESFIGSYLDFRTPSSSQSGFFKLGQILFGNVHIITDVLQSSPWQSIFGAILLFIAPTIIPNGLHGLAVSSVRDHDRAEGQYCDVYLSILEGDIRRALLLIHNEVGDRWASCHLCEILARAGSFNSSVRLLYSESNDVNVFLPGYDLSLREYLIMEYCSQLGFGGRRRVTGTYSPASICTVADYLMTLGRRAYGNRPLGSILMQEVLCRQPLDNDHIANKVADLARSMKFVSVYQSICKQRASFWWPRINLANAGCDGASKALLWAEKSETDSLSSMLQLTLKSGNLEALNRLIEYVDESFGNQSSNIRSNITKFLIDYRVLKGKLDRAYELHLDSNKSEKKEAKEMKKRRLDSSETSSQNGDGEGEENENWETKRDEAIRYLCRMIRSNSLVNQFRLDLICNVILWDEDHKIPLTLPVISVQDCQIIISAIEAAAINSRYRKDEIGEQRNKRIIKTRMVLNRLLARSMLLEYE